MATLLPGPFTVEMYHRLGELGIFDEDDRVELLDGQIVEMTPIGRPHWRTVHRLTNLLARRIPAEMSVSSQSSLLLSDRWEPQPDLAVVRNPEESARDWIATARDTVLVIEVCDTSLERDRDIKIPRYAREGIAEAWLVDVNSDTITCYRNPLPGGPGGYANAVVVRRGETLRPVQIPSFEITADEILD